MSTHPTTTTTNTVGHHKQQVLTSADFIYDAHPILFYVKMNFDFEGQRERELKLHQGDIVGVTKDNVQGWSVGKFNSKIGLFPTAFASPVQCGADGAVSVLMRVWRGYKFKKGLERKNRVREIICIINELIETEKNYLYFLDVLDTLYIQVFESRLEAKKPLISQEEIKKVFGNVRQIRNLTKILLNEVQKQKNENRNSGNIPKILDVFVKHLPFLNFYSDYVKGYDLAVEIVNEICKKNKEFDKLLKQSRDDPLSKGLGLRDLLPKPMQRIFGYKNLFDRLVKITPSDSVIYLKVRSLAENMEKIVSKINESKRHYETSQKVASQFSSLLKSWRKFMKEGRIKIQHHNEKGEEWADCYLASDIFAYTSNGKKDIVILPLIFSSVIENFGENSIILSTLKEPPITLKFTDQNEKTEWLYLTKKNIEEEITINKKKFGLTQEPTEEASHWIQSVQKIEEQNNNIIDLLKEFTVHKSSLSQYDSSIQRYKDEIRSLIQNIQTIQEERKKLDSTLDESKQIQQLVADQEYLFENVEKQLDVIKSLCADDGTFKKLFGDCYSKLLQEKRNFEQVRNQRLTMDSQQQNYIKSNTILDAKTQETIEELKREYGDEFTLIHKVIQQLDFQEINYEMVYQKQEYENRNKYLEEKNKGLEETNQRLNKKITKLYEKINQLEAKITNTLQKNEVSTIVNEAISVLEEKQASFQSVLERDSNYFRNQAEIDHMRVSYETELSKKEREIYELKETIEQLKKQGRSDSHDQMFTKLDDISEEEIQELKSQNDKLKAEVQSLLNILHQTRQEKKEDREKMLSQLDEINKMNKAQINCFMISNKTLISNMASSQNLMIEMQNEMADLYKKLENYFLAVSEKDQTIDNLRQQVERYKQESMKLQFSLAHSITKEMKWKKQLEEEKQYNLKLEQLRKRKSQRIVPQRFSINDFSSPAFAAAVMSEHLHQDEVQDKEDTQTIATPPQPQVPPPRPVTMAFDNTDLIVSDEIDEYVDLGDVSRKKNPGNEEKRKTISFFNPIFAPNSKQDLNILDEMRQKFNRRK